MKTVLVTGASGGMGAAICKKLLAEGCRVFGLDLRTPEQPGLEGVCCDLTSLPSLEQARDRVLQKTDHLDAIVHAAGIYDLDSLAEIDEERFTRIFQINVFGVYRINRLFTPAMGAGGRITIITSELGPLNPLPFTGVYAVTKGALEKYAYSLRSELQLRGISVSILRPGAVRTGLLNVSTAALERFVGRTRYYQTNAARFKAIVDRVENRSVPPERIAALAWKSLTDRRPRYVYNINRNILLRLMSALPPRFQNWILRLILKP